ncbi:MAG TPA: redoxin domain-containing protein [Bryobacteraceae bacterium]|nr:redoxin domain-containing protein [Bryobacteraceae bacterium]
MAFARSFLVAMALISSGCTSSSDQARAAPANKTRKALTAAPDFTLNDVNGRPVRLSDFRGKVVLLNFWATWCGPCKVEIPWFIEFEQKYKDRGLTVIGVAMDEEGWSIVKPYLAARRINYRVVIGTEQVGAAYGGVDSLPTTFIIDKDGRIASTHVGLVSKSDYENEILRLLGASGNASDKPAVYTRLGTAQLPQ